MLDRLTSGLNLTPDQQTGLGKWSEADFIKLARTGLRPNGTMVDTTQMPVPSFRNMTDVELKATYNYLRTLPALPYASK